MKRFILLIMMLMPFVAMAQNEGFGSLVEKYSNRDGVTAMNLDKSSLGMFLDGDEDLKDLENIENIIVIITQDKAIGEELSADAAEVVKVINAESMITTSDEDGTYRIYTTTKGDVVSSIIISIVGNEESGLIVIKGVIPIEKLNDIIHIESDKIEF